MARKGNSEHFTYTHKMYVKNVITELEIIMFSQEN